MPGLLPRRTDQGESADLFEGFDRLFEDWSRGQLLHPFARRWGWLTTDDLIRIDEYREDGTLVVRAELPGVDVDKDVTLTIADDVLHIEAERREEHEGARYLRHELRSGKLVRHVPVPSGIAESDIEATYKDGVLEIRIPTPAPAAMKKITVKKD